MASMDNPAGRLYEILSRLDRAAEEDANRSLADCWNVALLEQREAASDEGRPWNVDVELARYASLLTQLWETIFQHQDEAQIAMVRAEIGNWATPFFPNSRAFTAARFAREEIPEGASLRVLNSLSSYLSRVAPEGRPIEPAERASLRQALQDAIDATRDNADIEDELRGIIITRLHEIVWALDYYEVVGPAGIESACKQVRAEMVMDAVVHKAVRWPERVRAVVDRVFGAVTTLDRAMSAIETIKNLPGIGS